MSLGCQTPKALHERGWLQALGKTPLSSGLPPAALSLCLPSLLGGLVSQDWPQGGAGPTPALTLLLLLRNNSRFGLFCSVL